MKERELREHTDCSICRNKIGSRGLPLFWTATINRYGLALDALQRQAGLTQMFNGNASLAMVMGSDEDMAEAVMEPVTLTICEACAMETPLLMAALDSQPSRGS